MIIVDASGVEGSSNVGDMGIDVRAGSDYYAGRVTSFVVSHAQKSYSHSR